MTYLFVGYVLALLVSLFFASWRVAFWALAAEFFIAGLILLRGETIESWSIRIQMFDLLILRAIVVPLLLIGALKKLKLAREFDTVPANLVIWLFALVLMIGSYWLGKKLFPNDLREAFHIGTSVSGVLLGLFILSNQNRILGQVIGLLTFEAGILLTEVMGHHNELWELQVGLTLIFLWTILLFFEFLNKFSKVDTEQGIDPAAILVERDVL